MQQNDIESMFDFRINQIETVSEPHKMYYLYAILKRETPRISTNSYQIRHHDV